MKRENIQAIYPLLPNQEAFWLAYQHAQPDPGCLQATYRFHGLLDPQILEESLDKVVQLHDSLRATIQPRPGKDPLMVIGKHADVQIRFHDLQELDCESQKRAMDAVRDDELKLGVQLEDLMSSRFHVFQRSECRHELLWTFHHAFIDGWSSSVVIRDLLEQYHHVKNANPVPIRFAKFENFLKFRKTLDVERQLDFWREQLKGYSGMPTQFNQQSSMVGERRQLLTKKVQIDERRSANLNEMLQRCQLTTGTVASGMWGLTLSCLCGQSDIVFGSAVSGRSVPVDHVQDMVGLFSNVIPTRINVNVAEPLLDFLRRIQDNQFETQEHEHTPLSQITSLVKLPRERSFFETLLVVENYPVLATSGDLQLASFESGITTSYPVTVCLIPGEIWTIKTLFDLDLVNEERMDRLVSHFVDALANVPELCDRALGELIEVLPKLEDVRKVSGGPADVESNAANHAIEEDFGPATVGGPRNEIELKLTMILERILGLYDVRYDDNFFQIGGSSLTATMVLASIKSELGATLTHGTLIEHPTVEALAQQISDGNGNDRSKEIVRFNSCELGRPLICVHVGFVPVMFFRHLAAYFGNRPVLGTQSRGIAQPEPMYATVEEAATDFLSQIDSMFGDLEPSEPYDLLAYCAGGSVAFEMARQLEARGRPPRSLIIVDSPLKFSRRTANMAFFKKKHGPVSKWFPRYVRFQIRKKIQSPVNAMWRRWQATFSRSEKTRDHFRGTLVRDQTMKAHYEYKITKIETPMLLIRSSEYCEIPSKDFHADLGKHSSSGEVSIESVDGDHETILLEPTVKQVAATVKAFLEQQSSDAKTN